MNSLNEKKQRAHRHRRKRRLQKGRFLMHKRKEKKNRSKRQVSAGGLVGDDAPDCTRSDPRWVADASRAPLRLTGRLEHLHSDCSSVHISGAADLTSLPWSFFGLGFFHVENTSASTHAAVALDCSVCVIFIKILPSRLYTKCSGNSGGRTRGFGFLSAFTPGVEAPRLNQIPGWDYDLKINQWSCPS